MDDVDINNLRTIQSTCTGLITIEFLLCFAADVPHMTDQDNARDPLTALNSLLESISSLKQVIVNAYNSKNSNTRGGEDDDKGGNNGIWKRMIDHGWTVNIRDPPRRIWISSDDLVDFRTESDYNEYDRKLAYRESFSSGGATQKS
ncbi:hypothetical protein PG985_005645 [Apiospora marii]|uniref:uncharacterized protein n=1 Tax=Apiospora marii TaxID=335849 RepID=UPI00312FA04F